jgi:catechol 2,3-dioxygenase-like lactoylglutathione lyase family enzyme
VIDVQRVDFIARPVADVARASEFYGETLGLARNPSSDEHWAEYETMLLNTPEQTGTLFRPSNYAVALRVPEVAQSMQELKDKGVEFQFEEPYDSGVCHMAFFNDPDGNSLILHYRHKPYSDGSLP